MSPAILSLLAFGLGLVGWLAARSEGLLDATRAPLKALRALPRLG